MISKKMVSTQDAVLLTDMAGSRSSKSLTSVVECKYSTWLLFDPNGEYEEHLDRFSETPRLQ